MNKKLIRQIASTALLFSVGLSSAACLQKDPEKKTLDSLNKVADGIYVMDYYADYKAGEYLAANITDVTQFDIWMTSNLTHGVPTGDIPDFGCSSFAVPGSDGSHLFGRNYDMKQGDSLVIRTAPQSGYASIGIVDLMHVNIGSDGKYSMDDESARTLLLAAPWCICDGINEKGLGASILELSVRPTVIDTSKDDLLLYSAVRVILDNCATIDEAVTLLDSYDMYSPRSSATYHIFLTDTSGRAVTVEWTSEGELVTVEDTAVTNFPLYLGDMNKDYDHRYAKIHNGIDSGAMTSADAMSVLKTARQSNTHWSAVYDLDNFSVDVCFNTDYANTYSFKGQIGSK